MTRIRGLLLGGIAVIVAVAAYNGHLHFRAAASLAEDPRNKGIDVVIHHRWGILPNTAVVDLVSVDGRRSIADVRRVLLQIAGNLKDDKFETVYLSWRGRSRFMMDGTYFQILGREHGYQNPMYTIRTMPENLMRPSGDRAFNQWSGGLFGVVGKQMEDFSAFHKEWWLEATGF